MSKDGKVFKVGSRKSELALIQTNLVIEDLKKIYPERKFEIVSMHTMGDQILDRPLPKIGEKSLFTKELEEALSSGEVDLVVHSLKDLPTALPDGLAVGAILEREDARDGLLLNPKHRGLSLKTLPPNSIIGTSSLRRIAQLKRQFPSLVIKDIRGNLQTRLRKLDSGDYDGIILAVAGIHRMGWEHRISEILEESDMLYAVGQGALAVECRTADCSIFSPLSHIETLLRTVAERSLLCTLGGGCSAPVAVTSRLEGGILHLTAACWSLDGSITEQLSSKCSLVNENKSGTLEMYCGVTNAGVDEQKLSLAHHLGVNLANDLIDLGALKIIEEAKTANTSS
uniref:hydroxymethylbilane synthase n=1 Tax=Lygus hesperus TaxID=30085 RepID=A0A0A9X341_LYGHE